MAKVCLMCEVSSKQVNPLPPCSPSSAQEKLADAAEEEGSDDDLEMGAAAINFKCPISLQTLEEPVQWYFHPPLSLFHH